MEISTKQGFQWELYHPQLHPELVGPTLVTTRPRLVNTSDVWLLDLVKHVTAN